MRSWEMKRNRTRNEEGSRLGKFQTTLLGYKTHFCALVAMKLQCLIIGFPDRYKESYERSWKMIPNDDVDPYYTDNPSQAKSDKYAPQRTSTQDSSSPTNTSDAVTLPPPNPNKPLRSGNTVRIVGKSKPKRDYSYTQLKGPRR